VKRLKKITFPMLPKHDTFLEINLGALAHNYTFFRSKLDPKTLLLAVVKAYAYGSESVAVAKKLEELGADYLAVAFAEEGERLKKGGVTLPIMVFHPQVSGLETILKHNLEPCLYSQNIFNAFEHCVKQSGKNYYPVHLKFNTGLNRLGFSPEEFPWLKEKLVNSAFLKPTSIYSHLAASDDPEEMEFTKNQITSFKRIIDSCSPWLPEGILKHLLNTSGILNFPEAQFDMVRTGIGLHGYTNSPKIDQLMQPVASLKTRISQIHRVSPGEWVGYNKGFIADKKMTVATIPIGHADGIGRQFGLGVGVFKVQGQSARTLGNICMDMTMIDITDINCHEGDQVLFFGSEFSAELQAANASTISYELLTGISQRVARQIIQ
jgi:alanine racemase